jgi:hypothetical protein
MKWVQVNANTPLETFELWNDTAKVAGVSFNSSSRIMRMVSAAGKRLFFYEKKGWLVPKAFIKNEYGITLGKLETPGERIEKGYIELDGKKYHYAVNTEDNTRLDLYDDDLNKNIASCSFSTVLSKGYNKTRSLMNGRFPQLLLLLCWYSLQLHGNSTPPGSMSFIK